VDDKLSNPVPPVIESVRCTIFKHYKMKSKTYQYLDSGVVVAAIVAAEQTPAIILQSQQLCKCFHKYSDTHACLQMHKLNPAEINMDSIDTV